MRVFDRELRAPKRLRDGTHRAAALATTLRRARRVARAVGVTRVADVTGLDTLGIPVVSAIRPNGRSLSTSQGKGLSADHALASALMESIETWHAEHLALPVVRGTYAALRARGAIDPRTLPRPRGRLDGAPWRWVPGWDLMAARPVLVPDEAVTLDTVFRAPPRLDVSSNGLASGNHLLEAIAHGLCEVIERDAEARWRAARGRARVRLDSIVDPACRSLIARIHADGAAVGIWDLTSDVGVPVYGAAIVADPDEPAWRALGAYWGFGCHLDPAIALVRALTEAAQTRVTYIAGSRDDFFPGDYAQAADPDYARVVWRDLHDRRGPWRDHGAARALATDSFEGDVAVVLDRLRARGVRQAVAVDLSRPEHGVAVVKAIIPGRATDVARMG